MRPAEPAAAAASLQTCDSSPSDVAPSTANSTNCDSRPPLIRPASTSCAPSHKHEDDAAEGERDGDRDQNRARDGGVAGGVIGAFDRAGEMRPASGFGAERLHRAHRPEALRRERRRVGERVLRMARTAADHPARERSAARR